MTEQPINLLPGLPEVLITGRVLETSDALELAEWYIILGQLETSIRNIVLLQERYSRLPMGGKDHSTAEALYRDAVIQFVGCFGEEKKFKLSKQELYEKVPGGSEAIAYLQDLRDTFAAHNFGPQRQCFVTADIGPSGKLRLRHTRLTYSLPLSTVYEDYIRIFEIARSATKSKVEVLQRRLLDHLHSIGPEGINLLQPAEVRTPGPTEMRMSRRGFREKGRSGRPGRRG